jgi:ferredoxin
MSLKVAIIGSGAAALGALIGAQRTATKPKISLFDIGEDSGDLPQLSPHDPIAIKSYYSGLYGKLKDAYGLRFPPAKSHFGQDILQQKIEGKKRFFSSNHFGGLTNFWGATMLPFEDENLKLWPISKKDLDPYYRMIAEVVGVSGTNDGLNRYFTEDYSNRPPLTVLKGMQELNSSVNSRRAQGAFDILSGINRGGVETQETSGKACVYCGECMAGCFNGSVFNARTSISRMIDNKELKYVKARVAKFLPDRRLLLCSTAGDTKTEYFDRVYLCGGVPGTTEIIMRSLNIEEGPKIFDSGIFQFPILNFNFSASDQDKSQYFALANLIFICRSRIKGLNNNMVQLYPNADYIWRNCIPEGIWTFGAPMIRFLRDRLLWARLYTHSDNSFEFGVKLAPNQGLEFKELKRPSFQQTSEVRKSLKSAVNHHGFYMPKIPYPLAPTSGHLSSSFPYKGRLLPVSNNGECAPGVFICDSSCFPDSPALPTTFTIMANATRTVTETCL